MFWADACVAGDAFVVDDFECLGRRFAGCRMKSDAVEAVARLAEYDVFAGRDGLWGGGAGECVAVVEGDGHVGGRALEDDFCGTLFAELFEGLARALFDRFGGDFGDFGRFPDAFEGVFGFDAFALLGVEATQIAPNDVHFATLEHGHEQLFGFFVVASIARIDGLVVEHDLLVGEFDDFFGRDGGIEGCFCGYFGFSF